MSVFRSQKAAAPSRSKFERLAWAVLVYSVFVIVWGAVVRATGSGAGCGAHWPLCNGDVVPLAPRLATVIEFVHRSTSGVILLLTVLLVWSSFRAFAAGHAARRAAVWSMIFVLVEAAVGAGIVLLRLVEDNASALRAGYIAVHLVNTMMLTAAYTSTVFWSRPRGVTLPRTVRMERWLSAGLMVMFVLSASGAIVALGDTLFPPQSFSAGLQADFSGSSHFLIRLRLWHPVLAVAAALYFVGLITQSGALDDPSVRQPARRALLLIVVQVVLGAANVLFLAPLWLQMAHLVVANALWIALVWIWLTVRNRPALTKTRSGLLPE